MTSPRSLAHLALSHKTSLYLSLWIALGIVLQRVIYLGIVFWRHWMDYLTLRRLAINLDLPVPVKLIPEGDESVIAAWSGYRVFRVERKTVEDAAQSICSFYLVPEDGRPYLIFCRGSFLPSALTCPQQKAAPNQSFVAIHCRMHRDPMLTVFRSSAFRHPSAVIIHRAVRPITFTIRSKSEAACRCARHQAISTSSVVRRR